MAVSADTVKAAIVSTIKAITLPDTNTRFSDAFEKAAVGDAAGFSGADRTFAVWFGAGEIGEVVHPTESHVKEQFVVTVVYAAQADLQAQDAEWRADIQRLRAALDAVANWATDVVHQQVKRWIAPAPVVTPKARVLTLVVDVEFFESNS